MGKVIGRQGKIAKALRTLVRAGSLKENKKYNKWIESLNKNNHRLNNIINELEEYLNVTEITKEEGNILLFMDEVHTLIGAGGAEGALLFQC